MANTQRAKGPAAKVEDFIPRVRPARRRQSADEMAGYMRALAEKQKDK